MRSLKRAWREAQRLLTEHGVRRAPVPIKRIAEHYARVVYAPLDDDISGMLIPHEGGWVIAVNERHPATRQHFTMAHELGHLILHNFTAPHADGRFAVRFRDETSTLGKVTEEVEANQFAAELLMPRALVLKEFRGAGFDYAPSAEDDPEAFATLTAKLASQFGVSQQALTIRLSTLLV